MASSLTPPPVYSTSAGGNVTAVDAMRRYGGMYGAAYINGQLLQEAIEVSGNVAVSRIEVPLVGTTRTGYKTGRETREGTMRIQQIDSTWALQVYQFTSQNLSQRIAARNSGSVLQYPAWDMVLTVDDPEAYDYESWQLQGCQAWQMPVGFAITDDIIQREIPITWEEEAPLHVFTVDRTTLKPTPYATPGPTTTFTLVTD